jgi:hypothetical protein
LRQSVDRGFHGIFKGKKEDSMGRSFPFLLLNNEKKTAGKDTDGIFVFPSVILPPGSLHLPVENREDGTQGSNLRDSVANNPGSWNPWTYSLDRQVPTSRL